MLQEKWEFEIYEHLEELTLSFSTQIRFLDSHK